MNQYFTLDYDSITRFEKFISSNTEKAIIRTLPANHKGQIWIIGACKHIDKGTVTLHNLTREYALDNGFRDIPIA